MIRRIGIVGGGQLGKMMCLAAKQMDFYIVILDPTADCPAHSVSDEHIIKDFYNEAALKELAGRVDVVTYEIEHINAGFLSELQRNGHLIYPTPDSLLIIQDKLAQKKLLSQNHIPVPAFMAVDTFEDIMRAVSQFGLPLMLKSRFGGYDGRGNFLLRNEASIARAVEFLGENSLIAEQWVDYVMEASILACRGVDGGIRVYPVAENIHHENILRQTLVPAELSEGKTKAAMDLATNVMNIFKGVGMFCVELFITRDGLALVNEIAPRPHNSGHYTIEACVVSQFENHIRSVSGLPLGDPSLIKPAVMMNLLGSDRSRGEGAVCLGLENALKINGVSVHIYGKRITKPMRKMGHITAIGGTREEALARADIAFRMLEIV
ncbi:MAG: 5-(carboxyamino)imidazole ribonucleotide synthase [Clostridiales bacterium]|jgi:5-(carboxyamino)imidazole ribonucleotide synthase|nr:5-(carboxyamino)imidazole ribonucleotide synthase [Clostridiales bacterium]